MRVSRISVSEQSPRYYAPRKNINHNNINLVSAPKSPEFKGKFGAWLGGVAGAAAVVATALLAAPAAICLTGGGAIIGAIGGHVAEDAVNGEKNGD